jgi:MerR family transcriptional regulator/heat shock protein HspR
MEEINEDTPLFVISVAAELAEMHPQTLRQYDNLGLVVPERTAGKSRRYTMRNVAQLKEVARLSAEGVSLAGIKRILELENQNVELRKRVRDLETTLANELMNRPGARVFASGDQGVVTLQQGKRPAKNSSVVLWAAARR